LLVSGYKSNKFFVADASTIDDAMLPATSQKNQGWGVKKC